MSQYISDSFKTPRDVSIRLTKRRSRLAQIALWCSLLVILPLAGVFAMALSWLAMRSMRNDASITGRRVATFAASLGLVVTAGQALVGYQVFAAWRVLHHGPGRALHLAFAGDAAAFQDAFLGAGTVATTADVSDFVRALQMRYGPFIGAEMADPDRIPLKPESSLLYHLQFERAIVPAVARVVFVQTEPVVAIPNRMRFLRVLDGELGDLTFPRYGGHEASIVPPVADYDASVRGGGDEETSPPTGASASGESGSRP